jgi:predicted molibdopterin-dependent oxidoreductase YjgC
LGEAKPEWRILGELASMAGHQDSFKYSTEMEITKEIVRVVPAYKEVNVESLYQGADQWADKRVRFKRFNPIHFRGTEEDLAGRYPFVLVSFRSPYHFLTNEMTSQSETLSKFPEGPFVYLNAVTASKKGVQDGDRVRLTSRVAFLDGTARIGLHFHFRDLLLNRLMPLDFDPETFTPNYKAVAVDVVRVNALEATGEPEGLGDSTEV